MADYVIKLMLLEAVKAYGEGDHESVAWIENKMVEMVYRWERLKDNGKK